MLTEKKKNRSLLEMHECDPHLSVFVRETKKADLIKPLHETSCTNNLRNGRSKDVVHVYVLQVLPAAYIAKTFYGDSLQSMVSSKYQFNQCTQ